MLTSLTILQFIIIAFLAIAVLLQQSSSDGLSSLSGSNSNIMSSKASVNFMTKLTFVLAFIFMINGLFLAKMTLSDLHKSSNIIESIINEPNKENELNVPLSD